MKKLPLDVIKRRRDVVAELVKIPPLPETTRRLLALSGFMEYYFSLENLYTTKKEAYEALEEIYIGVVGHRRYSDFKAFSVVQTRWLKKY